MQSSIVSLLLRVVLSVMMMIHGWPKFYKVLIGDWTFADPIGLGVGFSLVSAAFAEFICGIFLIIGFKSKWMAIPPAFVMFVAAFIIHADDGWRKMELPVLYLIGYLCIIILGSGRYSFDARFKSR